MIGAQNVALRDVRTTKKAALCCDVGRIASFEEVLTEGRTVLRAPIPPSRNAPPAEVEEYQRLLVIWERLRELAAKAAVEAYAKEVVYGAPLLSGFLPKRAVARYEPVMAPLLMQAVTLAVGDEGEIVVTSSDEPPRFNTAVWQDTVRADDLQQIVGLGIDAQGDLAAGFDPERVSRLLTAIATIMPAVEAGQPDGTLEPWVELRNAKARRDQAELRLHNGAVLFLANRASPYLLHDLEAIADDPSAAVREDRPLNVLLNPPASEVRPELESRSLEDVVYPFPSNAAQRQVADAVAKNRIVVVQGPPGNGKSLTIANLVAHLVANGNSVLVSSHKNQALTVVRDKLESGSGSASFTPRLSVMASRLSASFSARSLMSRRSRARQIAGPWSASSRRSKIAASEAGSATARSATSSSRGPSRSKRKLHACSSASATSPRCRWTIRLPTRPRGRPRRRHCGASTSLLAATRRSGPCSAPADSGRPPITPPRPRRCRRSCTASARGWSRRLTAP